MYVCTALSYKADCDTIFLTYVIFSNNCVLFQLVGPLHKNLWEDCCWAKSEEVSYIHTYIHTGYGLCYVSHCVVLVLLLGW